MRRNTGTMMSGRELTELQGQPVIGPGGDRFGKVQDVYTDVDTGRPEWLAVSTGWFRGRKSFVPLDGVQERNGEIFISYDEDTVKSAPTAEMDGELSPQEEEGLYRHYGSSLADRSATMGGEADAGRGAMTRSEEELRVARTREEAGRARLRKWVETEHVSEAVPVSREEVRIEREPITEGNVDEAMSGPGFKEDTHEEVLYEDRVVADKQEIPKERVRLAKEAVTDEQQVEADLRKERIGFDEDASRRRDGGTRR